MVPTYLNNRILFEICTIEAGVTTIKHILSLKTKYMLKRQQDKIGHIVKHHKQLTSGSNPVTVQSSGICSAIKRVKMNKVQFQRTIFFKNLQQNLFAFF